MVAAVTPSPARAPAVRFENVDIVFGRRPEAAFPLIDAGRPVAEINAASGQIVGVMGASLTVAAGETVVLMGLSGSGKSTLVRAVNGLNPVSRGRVFLGDGDRLIDVGRCDGATLRRIRRERVAMVFQQFGLLPWRTVADNVALGLELARLPKAEIAGRVAAELELVHLESWADKRVDQLSGGMQQRVGLARAFATRAPLLLMDEPFSALDPLIRDRLQDELVLLKRRLGRTIVFVSHDLDEAMKLGDRIAIMAAGRIVQVGTPQEIVMAPATDYVAEFVAHINPLNVLTAADMLEPMDGAEAGADADRLADGAAAAPGRTAVVPPALPVRAVMAAAVASGRPVLVEDGGRIVGRITADQIMRAILRKR